jgi:hypothetical protein
MSDYKTEYALRYTLINVHQQIEVAAVIAAGNIITEDPATPDHVNRLNWANFVMGLSVSAIEVFKWPVAQNPTIQASVAADPSGDSVTDSDVQFVVNSNVDMAVEQYKSSPYYRPPPV